MKRRQLLAGGVALGAAGLMAGLGSWRDRGVNHNAYFNGLAVALDAAGLARPTLVIDRQRLLANADVIKQRLAGNYDYRVVAKSLPSLPLLNTVMQRTGTNRLMVFHQPFLNLMAREMPAADILLGKPMPVAAAARFYQEHRSNGFVPAQQLQWLVDSPQRMHQYGELAQQLQQTLRVNLELDVGLHRGGFADELNLVKALRILQNSPWLELGGLMGYEPHVAKMPGVLGGPEAAFSDAQQRYQDLLRIAETTLQYSLADKTLNAAGSPTYQYYNGSQVANELSAGSALVKPTDFDLDSLVAHQPAAFIATPVIKTLPAARVPGVEALATLQRWLNPNAAQAFFIYGGYWKAKPESPAGLSNNGLYGRSTNQEMLMGSNSINLQPDDWVFLRPSQSEHVFLQFGDIAVYEQGNIVEQWPVFSQGA